ncbi:MAG: prepilin-type cleavage/methylation domain-containing protein [Planctomycetaceae bacterium]
MLTLSMAVVLMSLVGATLQFYATNMNVRDSDVRRVHLASSILQMIADDLRASLHGSAFDASTLESFLASSATGEVESAAAALDPAAAEVLGTASAEDALLAEPTTTETTDLMSSTLTLTKPGLIGNQFQIQFDISRLPRLEQWAPTLSATPGVMADVPSDIKTVTYYVQAPGTIAGVVDPLQGYLPSSAPAGQQTASGGLVRRELDRAASNWATESGGLTGLLMTGDLIASEVVAIGFEYFDGIIWQIMWNSDEVGAMPKAIRITLTISDPDAVTDTASLAAGMDAGTRTFTHVVLLPVGMTATESTETTETLPAADSSGTATSASGGSL